MPVIRWQGWRPLPLDLTRDEQGGQVFVVLDREGDLMLLPTATISYICYAPLDGESWADHGIDPVCVSHSAAAARHVVMQAVQELAADGWHVIGRLQATFHGVDTEDDFWLRVDCSDEEVDKLTSRQGNK